MISDLIMKNYDRAAEMVEAEEKKIHEDTKGGGKSPGVSRMFWEQFSMHVATVKAELNTARVSKNKAVLFCRERTLEGIEAIERDAHRLGG